MDLQEQREFLHALSSPLMVVAGLMARIEKRAPETSSWPECIQLKEQLRVLSDLIHQRRDQIEKLRQEAEK